MPQSIAADPYGRRPLWDSEETIDCVKCSAPKGERCRNKHGLTASAPHQYRIRDHLRQRNAVPPDWRKLPPVDRSARLRKQAILAAIIEGRSIADAIVRARTTGRIR